MKETLTALPEMMESGLRLESLQLSLDKCLRRRQDRKQTMLKTCASEIKTCMQIYTKTSTETTLKEIQSQPAVGTNRTRGMERIVSAEEPV